MVTTDRLFLVPAGLPALEAIVDEDWAQLSILLGGVDFADNWYHFPEAYLWMRDFAQENGLDPDWWTYLVIHRGDHRVIGTCGYKGAPGPDGMVEIGYEIADSYQQQGFATEAARALCARAWASESVNGICAHTLAEENASVALLRRLGFTFIQELIDLEDGKIWEWRLERAHSG